MSTEIVIDLTTPTMPRMRAPSIFRAPFVAVSLGIVLPIVCVLVDPIIFNAGIGRPILGSYRTMCYELMALSMLSLAGWLLSRRVPSVFTGLLFGGCVFAILLGIVMLPISVISLLAFIGILGFSPFLTAAVFWHAAKHAREVAGVRFKPVLAAITFFLFIAVPVGTHVGMSRITNGLLSELADGTDRSAELASGRLKVLGPLVDTDLVAWRYYRTASQLARERLAKVFLELTGEDIDQRVVRRFL